MVLVILVVSVVLLALVARVALVILAVLVVGVVLVVFLVPVVTCIDEGFARGCPRTTVPIPRRRRNVPGIEDGVSTTTAGRRTERGHGTG